MKSLIFLLFIIPSASLASSDIREAYINAVKGFSLCGNALMPWGHSTWRPDEIEKPYVEQSKLNQIKMKAEIDDKFYTEAILSKLFVDLTANFYAENADITAQLKQLPSDDHVVIWSSLFELEKEARLIREELMIDFHLHAEIIKSCAAGLTKP